ncbi:MAG TPA: rhamnosidase, partial [Planctomycetaceae bacterium]|nr:rhamnosidase [Planctomycetaceae bacterium]
PPVPKPHFAILAVAADSRYVLFVNGRRVAAGKDAGKANWHILGNNLQVGRNVIAVRVDAAKGRPATLAIGIRQSYFGGERRELKAQRWLCSAKAGKNWFQPDFKADGWVEARRLAPLAGGPLGEPEQSFDGPRRSCLMRKEFSLPAKPTRARLYVTGLGWYRIHINGMRVGCDEFRPGWTQYEKRLQYQVYEVTELLREGRNAIGAILGNGWWSSGLGWAGGNERHAKPGENLRLLAQLEIETAGGCKYTISTDGTWSWHFGPIVEDTIYHGEHYDARLAQPGWDRPGFDAFGWHPVKVLGVAEPGKLCAQKCEPVRVTQVLKPVKITEPKPGLYVLDFGQNHSGRPRLKLQAPRGTKVTIELAEILRPDGLIDDINLRSARATDVYICRGGAEETWEPAFTYHGYRYAQVSGLPARPTAETIVSHVLHNATLPAGKFDCSNKLLNRIWRNVLWGQRSNFMSVPTDCPQRDERLGWLGDAQAFCPTSIWNMHMAAFYTKWLRDILDAQQPDGAVPG